MIKTIKDIQDKVQSGFTDWSDYGKVHTKEQGGLDGAFADCFLGAITNYQQDRVNIFDN